MRNPLKRRPSTEPKPSLRERLRATKAKAGRVLAVNRILLQPDPKPAPAVDRVALVNYATFLTYEHRRVQGEMYPHMSPRRRAFTLGLCAAERFFFGPGSDRGPDVVPPASSRAVRVLDFVGVNWREDLTDSGRRAHLDAAHLQDDGKRPPLPHGWPALDAGLVTAVKDARLLDAAISALLSDGDRDTDEVPGFDALDEVHAEALATLVDEPAEGLPGLQAKAAGLMLPSQQTDFHWLAKLGLSLARDLLGAHQGKIAPQPDPIIAAIEEAKRLSDAYGARGAETVPESPASQAVFEAAGAASHRFCEDVLLKTVPRTGEGCAALARYASEHYARWGHVVDENDHGDAHLRVLDLIARSPLL